MNPENINCKNYSCSGITSIVEGNEVDLLNKCLKLSLNKEICPCKIQNKSYLGKVSWSAPLCPFYFSFGYDRYCTNQTKIKEFLTKKQEIDG